MSTLATTARDLADVDVLNGGSSRRDEVSDVRHRALRTLITRDQRALPPLGEISAIAAVLVMLALALAGYALHLHDLRGIAVTVFLLIGVGVAPCLLVLRRVEVATFVLYAAASSIAISLGVGFLMALSGDWSSSVATTVAVTLTLVLIAYLLATLAFTHPNLRLPTGAFVDVTARINALSLAATVGMFVSARSSRAQPAARGFWAHAGPAWYVGLIVLLACVIAARAWGVSPAWPLIALGTIVVLSQAAKYGAPNVVTASRHVGIVEYIRAHHSLDRSIDIYQAWPALFAGAAWICDAAGIHDPMVLATWWPALLSALLVLGVRVLAGPLVRTNFRAWMAGAIFGLANTLNITYFSPQSAGLLFALVAFTIVFSPRRPRPVTQGNTRRGVAGRVITPAVGALSWQQLLAMFAFQCVTTVTHQISPYLFVAALVALVVFGFLRPWWTPLLMFAPALAWALVNRGVLGRYVSLGAIGRLFDNVAPPSHGGGGTASFAEPITTRIAFDLPALILLVVAIVAVATTLHARSRLNWAILFASASSVSLIVASDYGQEGIFRVALFALPWLAVLAVRGNWPGFVPRGPVVVLGLVALMFANLFGQTALDSARMVRPDFARETRQYELTAPSGSVALVPGLAQATPSRLTKRYLDVEYLNRSDIGPSGMDPTGAGSSYDAQADVANLTAGLVRSVMAPAYYALVSDATGAYDNAYGYQHYADFQRLERAFATDPDWVVLERGSSSALYRLRDPSRYTTSALGTVE